MVGLNTSLKSGRWWENQGRTDLNIVTGNRDGPLTLRTLTLTSHQDQLHSPTWLMTVLKVQLGLTASAWTCDSTEALKAALMDDGKEGFCIN